MPEDLNAEIAEKIGPHEAGHDDPLASTTGSFARMEIVEAILIAIVAVATAWGGYQAARWDGRQAELYAESSTLRTDGSELLTLGGQQKLLDVATFNTWIEARNQGRDDLAALYERRFSPEFKVAFDAWIALRPFDDPDAPPGPAFMPEYRNPLIVRGADLNAESDRLFDEGTDSRQQADEYIRTTVVLATVLFLLALSQRFRVWRVRVGVVALAAVLMVYGVVAIATFQRL
jgi:hypothetical protein